ncbi:uncharacterized protein LOC134673310 [Cydia fagiglandana]|uniref:uncharacterized protein LOC134673310 n=1 Tax=Cydia fagiglandana TaxID=1458189 RepID=UPI002FEE59BF
MASTPVQVNGNANKNSPLGKRKKSRGSKGSYLSKWLDKTMCHIQESTPSMDTYDSFMTPNMNWGSQFAPGYDPCRFNMFGYAEPMSLPTPPTYCSPAMPLYPPEYRYVQSVNKSVQVQRPRPRRRSDKPEDCSTPNSTPLNTNYFQPKNCSDSQDFASLPPIVTSVGDTNSNSDMNTNEKDECARRYSDPCVQGLPDIARPANGEVDSVSEDSSGLSGSQVGSRLLTYLLDQITSLKMTNERLNKDLQETRAELSSLRTQHSIWQKGSSSSIGGNNGLVGGQYSPGYVTDLVREIRDSARIREEALYARVRAMLLERDNGLASPETKFSEKTLEEIKSSLRASEADKRRMMDRVSKLEDELRLLRVSTSLDSSENGITNGTEDAETERLRLRKELASMKKAKQNAEEHAFKLERLVTQLRSKFNGLQTSPNGPESLPSETEQDPSRARRTSVNSNTTVVFGPVTDL